MRSYAVKQLNTSTQHTHTTRSLARSHPRSHTGTHLLLKLHSRIGRVVGRHLVAADTLAEENVDQVCDNLRICLDWVRRARESLPGTARMLPMLMRELEHMFERPGAAGSRHEPLQRAED